MVNYLAITSPYFSTLIAVGRATIAIFSKTKFTDSEELLTNKSFKTYSNIFIHSTLPGFIILVKERIYQGVYAQSSNLKPFKESAIIGKIALANSANYWSFNLLED